VGTIDENWQIWGSASSWIDGGDTWSSGWGGPRRQWDGWIWPRLEHAIAGAGPASELSVVEIGCGHGRWTQFLAEQFAQVHAVDLVPTCVEECTQRFSGTPNVSTMLTDGCSLDGVDSRSVDLVFSFDSLVHADAEAISGYLREAARVLTDDGVVFLHHSNLASCGWDCSPALRRSDRLARVLVRAGVLEPHVHWRDPTVDADLVARRADDCGLVCVGQELLPWATKKALIDCVSVIVRDGRPPSRSLVRTVNRRFGDEMRDVASGGHA